jgi:hypothetical protein
VELTKQQLDRVRAIFNLMGKGKDWRVSGPDELLRAVASQKKSVCNCYDCAKAHQELLAVVKEVCAPLSTDDYE